MILQKVNNKLNLNAKIYMHKIKHKKKTKL